MYSSVWYSFKFFLSGSNNKNQKIGKDFTESIHDVEFKYLADYLNFI